MYDIINLNSIIFLDLSIDAVVKSYSNRELVYRLFLLIECIKQMVSIYVKHEMYFIRLSTIYLTKYNRIDQANILGNRLNVLAFEV